MTFAKSFGALAVSLALTACALVSGLGDFSEGPGGDAPDATDRDGARTPHEDVEVPETSVVDGSEGDDTGSGDLDGSAEDVPRQDANGARDASCPDGGPIPCGAPGASGAADTGADAPNDAGPLACGAGLADCDGKPGNGCETNLNDPDHCGSCDTVCSSGICGTSIGSWTTSPTRWQLNGSATIGPGVGMLGLQTAVLTPATSSLAGTIIYRNPIVTDSFTATFSAYLGSGGGADGMGFMWQTQGPTALGANGGCLGMCGLPGFGVELDTYNNGNCGDMNTNHVAVDQLSGCSMSYPTHVTANANPPYLDNLKHDVVVQMTSGAVSVTVDGTSVLSGVALPSFVPGTPYYFGFAAGTGGANDAHEVSSNAAITFPTPRCL